MELYKKLESLKLKFEKNLSPEKLAIMHRATDELIESNPDNRVIGTGVDVPDFELVDQYDRVHKSTELYELGPLVISFYRGVWCPYCNIDLSYLGKAYAQIKDLGAELVVISPNLPRFSQYAVERHKLPFNILTDFQNQVGKRFGLIFQVQEALRDLYLNSFEIDLEKYNGEDSWTLPMPARFVIDTRGIIQYAEYSPDYTKRPEITDLLKTLENLRVFI